MTQLTDKNFVLMLKGGYKIYLNQEQYEKVITMVETNQAFIRMEKGIFKASEIIFILPASEVEKEERKKNGEWQCRYGEWHERGERCGHAELEKYIN